METVVAPGGAAAAPPPAESARGDCKRVHKYLARIQEVGAPSCKSVYIQHLLYAPCMAPVPSVACCESKR
jgi:hypothetical protein